MCPWSMIPMRSDQDVGLLQVLLGQKHGHALVAGEPRDLLPQRRAALRVQARRGLVEEQDPRGVHQRERQVQPSLSCRPSSRRRGGRQPRSGRRAGATHRCARGAPPADRPCRVHLEHQVLAAREDRVKRGLLERRADRRADLAALAHDCRSRQRSRAHCVGGSSVVRIRDGRRLTGAVGSEEAVDLTGCDTARSIPSTARGPLLELADELLDLDGLGWVLTGGTLARA